MTEKNVTATRFKSDCLRLIEVMKRDREPVVITRHGKPVARLSPIDDPEPHAPLFGSMQHTIVGYGDIIAPAADLEEWDALR